MKTLKSAQAKALLDTLEERFGANMSRHEGLKWAAVAKALAGSPEKLWSLNEMEKTGGEPDVVGYDKKSKQYLFFDCAPDSPKERRSVCYDPAALASRKKHKPRHSALGMAEEMGVELLDEQQYRALQELGDFDTRTSSWLLTPPAIRDLGGAIFGDRRFDTVFVYHNGVESYYAGRGFRCVVRV